MKTKSPGKRGFLIGVIRNMESPLEFYERLTSQDNPSPISIARLGQYALTALVRGDLHIHDFWQKTLQYQEYPLLLDDPSGHVPRTMFMLSDLTYVLGAQMTPERVYLQGIGPTNRQFTFRLGKDGKPVFQVYPVSACI